MRSIGQVRRTRSRLGRVALLGTVAATLLALGQPSAAATSYPSPAGGTREVVGPILTHYKALGGPTGFLGGPLTGQLTTPSLPGRYNHFAGGSIYWSQATGAWSVRGAIRDAWGGSGWENGPLGFPTSDERSTPNGKGRFNLFAHGGVYWTPTTGAHSIYGAIRDRWAGLGWETSSLGFPTSDEFAIPGGRAQDFQHGSIRWTRSGGAVLTDAALPLGVAPSGSQLITVAAPTSTATTATLTAWQRGPLGWTPVAGPVSARVGSAGVGKASESSSKTPAGAFRLTTAFGRAADPGTALPYRRVDRNDWWVSDTASSRSNTPVRCAPGSCSFDERDGENLYAAGSVYDNAVVIDYNRTPVVRGAGSAFFLHIGNGRATAGCVSIGKGTLQQVMRWLKPSAAPVISIGVG
jgi:L,D-peptidoglycan transpeptidase YkuD (ErfK/YbiS/YcfS/YnhG family)